MPFSIPVWMILLLGMPGDAALPLPDASDAPAYRGSSASESRSVYDRTADDRDGDDRYPPSAAARNDGVVPYAYPDRVTPAGTPTAPATAILPFRRAATNEGSSNEPASVRHDTRPAARYEPASDRYAVPGESRVQPATFEQPSEAIPATRVPTVASEPEKPTDEKKSNERPLKLAPKSTTGKQASGHPRTGSSSGIQPLITVGGSLAAVLALFFVTAWFTRRTGKTRNRALPNEVVELLGRTSLMPKQSLQMLRVGNKLLLVSITPGCVETITEITEPAEVERLAGLCQQSKTGSMTQVFQQVLTKMEREPAPGGFLGLEENFTRTDPEDDATRAIRKRRGGRYV